MPRRVFTYPDIPWYGILNFISTAGAFLMGLSAMLLVYIIYKSKKSGRPAGDDPWNAFTLEWATSSPPPLKNFDELPDVHGSRPLWNLKYPDKADK